MWLLSYNKKPPPMPEGTFTIDLFNPEVCFLLCLVAQCCFQKVSGFFESTLYIFTSFTCLSFSRCFSFTLSCHSPLTVCNFSLPLSVSLSLSPLYFVLSLSLSFFLSFFLSPSLSLCLPLRGQGEQPAPDMSLLQVPVPDMEMAYWCQGFKLPPLEEKHHVLKVGTAAQCSSGIQF